MRHVMTEIENSVREPMRAHDTLAPTTADFRFRTPEGRRAAPWLVAVAAAACVLVVATVALLVRHRGHHHVPAPLASHQTHPVTPIHRCPAELPAGVPSYWIPQRAKGVDAAKRFIPLETPTDAVVCSYLRGGRGKLTGTRTLDSGYLSTIPADLAWLPPTSDKQPCTSILEATDGDYYLMALTYRGGTMWVSIPGNHCLSASNGAFLVHNLRLQAAAAALGGRWRPLPPTGQDGCPQTVGRLGQQDRLVPERPVSLQACRPGKQSRAVTAKQSDLARLMSELNRVRTTPWAYEFQCGSAGRPSARYLVTFSYRVGPPVQIEIQEGCHPEIDNGSLQGNDASSVLPLVKHLLGSP